MAIINKVFKLNQSIKVTIFDATTATKDLVIMTRLDFYHWKLKKDYTILSIEKA